MNFVPETTPRSFLIQSVVLFFSFLRSVSQSINQKLNHQTVMYVKQYEDDVVLNHCCSIIVDNIDLDNDDDRKTEKTLTAEKQNHQLQEIKIQSATTNVVTPQKEVVDGGQERNAEASSYDPLSSLSSFCLFEKSR